MDNTTTAFSYAFDSYSVSSAPVINTTISPSALPMAHSLAPTSAISERRHSYPDQHSSASVTYSPPPGLSCSPSTSAASEVIASPASNPTNTMSKETWLSPLAGKPEYAHVVIPPLVPPVFQSPMNDVDEDELPALLRQDLRADKTPRRPMNTYFIYMRERRHEFGQANPTMTTGEISKLLGKEWGALTPERKEPWQELHERMKRVFNKKWPNYQYERSNNKKGRRRGRSAPDSPPGSLRLVNMPTAHYAPRYVPYEQQVMYSSPQPSPVYQHFRLPPPPMAEGWSHVPMQHHPQHLGAHMQQPYYPAYDQAVAVPVAADSQYQWQQQQAQPPQDQPWGHPPPPPPHF